MKRCSRCRFGSDGQPRIASLFSYQHGNLEWVSGVRYPMYLVLSSKVPRMGYEEVPQPHLTEVIEC